MTLRPHQLQKSTELLQILQQFKIAYLFGEVRSGKTLTALNTAQLFYSNDVLVVTKKKAIPSIQADYEAFNFTYKLTCINYESVHKIERNNFDLVIYDEAHCLGAYPKPSKTTKLCKQMFSHIPCLLMTGTPHAESVSQLYHQFYVSKFSPFSNYVNFYKWAKDFVNIEQKRIGSHTINDYSNAKEVEVFNKLKKIWIVMTQQDAGFDVNINEHILSVEPPKLIKDLTTRFIKDKAIEGETGAILGDTPAKFQSKLHQLFNGTCIIEDWEGNTKPIVLSHYKANFIRDYFFNKKIAIIYYYQAELEILKKVFPHNLTTDVDEFNETYYNIAVQNYTTEGMNLSKADALVYYNLGFSGKNFVQSRDRMTVKGRQNNNVYFVCEKGGMTYNILKRVRDKMDYNFKEFKKDYGI